MKRLAIALLGALALSACDPMPQSWKTPHMTALSPRLQPLFASTKPVCFGRFVIDVPSSAEVVWGPPMIPWSVAVFPGEAGQLNDRVSQREQQLKAEVRFPASKGLPMYFETLAGLREGQRMVVSQREFDTTGDFRVESFLTLGNDLVLVTGLGDERTKTAVIAELNDMARRLRPLGARRT